MPLQSRCVMLSGRGAQSPPSDAGHARVRILYTVKTSSVKSFDGAVSRVGVLYLVLNESEPLHISMR